jgi:prepilin-type N-terminal cleavage/methylation domain-containing protein
MTHARTQKQRGRRSRRDADGFTLIELSIALVITMILLTVVPSVIAAVSDANSYARGTTAGSVQARTAIQDLQYRVQSASQICLPTQLTTVGPTVTAGFAVRVQTQAFGKSLWDQWMLNTSTHVLQEQEWPTTWVTGNAVPAWNTIATTIVNSSTAPFSLPTGTTGSPQTLTVDFQVTQTYGNKVQIAELKSSIAAFNTPYTSNPTVSCATASTQEGWT